jgi:hypothetical protein
MTEPSCPPSVVAPLPDVLVRTAKINESEEDERVALNPDI